MKISEFFEKHVQWIALGLAGLWLVWVGWTYGVNRPEVEISGTKYSAGNVDEHIRDTDAAALAVKLGNQTVPPGLLEVPDFTEAFVSAMNGTPPVQAAPLAFNSPQPYLLTDFRGDGTPNKPGPKWVVNEFPKTVVPTAITVLTGRSLAAMPQNQPA